MRARRDQGEPGVPSARGETSAFYSGCSGMLLEGFMQRCHVFKRSFWVSSGKMVVMGQHKFGSSQIPTPEQAE